MGDAPERAKSSRSRLAANTIGLIGLATLGAVMMSPALGIYGNWGPMASTIGKATPLVFLAALAISLPTAISYALINREMPSAGSAFTWVWEAVSPTTGIFVGLIMAVYYTVAVTLQPIFFGLFFNDLLKYIGVDNVSNWTWAIGVALVTVIVMFMTYRGVAVSTRWSLLFMAIEILVVVALAATIVVNKLINGGFTLAPFNPGEIHGGVSTFWTAIILGILSYTGYDVISTVAEEAKAPRQLLPKATLLACVLVGIFWALGAWAFSISVPVSEVERLTASGLTAATPIADQYWHWGRIFVILTAMTAAAAVYIVTVVGSSRVYFAMARENMLPASGWLSQLNEKYKVPWHAMHLVYGLVLVGIVVLTSALGLALDAFVWWAGVIVFFALITYTFVNVANIVYFRRFARDRFNWFLNGVVPVAGIGIDVYLIYKSFFKTLWNNGWRLGQSIVVFSLVLVALALLWTLYVKFSAPERLQKHVSILEPEVEEAAVSMPRAIA
jgi:amino acid transporter